MKRINFKNITIKNFLSIGEEPVTVIFDKGLHIITGENRDKPDRRNAIGKSTIADAIYFSIFGETQREIKKDLIPNNLTSGKSHIELDFEIITPSSNSRYKIIRTLSPTKVSIYENDIDKTRDSIANTTKYILDLLSASQAIFKNCVIMTINNTIPFMAKTKAEKRKFIEDIFGMEVFSQMITQLRSEYNDIKREYDISCSSAEEIQRTLDNLIKQRNTIIEKKAEKKVTLNERKLSYAIEREDIVEYIKTKEVDCLNNFAESVISYEKAIVICDTKITNVTTEIATNKQKIISHKDIFNKIGTQEDKCPSCLREMKEHDIELIVNEKNNIKAQIELIALQIKDAVISLETITSKKKIIKDKISTLHEQIKQSSLYALDLKNKHERLKELDDWALELAQDINSIDKNNTDFDDVILETETRLLESKNIVDSKKIKLEDLDIVKFIVSEEGVKSYIVNKLLSLLNNKLLFYLKKLDSNSVCTFNEYFEEEILNEKNKVCSYFNFSGAERKAIDLACLFAFSDLRRIQGGVQYNIAVYDELFDSSFDEKGLELVTTILKERVEMLDECAMIISHRKESTKAATGNIIYLIKENGITKRVQCLDL